jgi:ribosomal protein S18 acetylase RimI-like enzyme
MFHKVINYIRKTPFVAILMLAAECVLSVSLVWAEEGPAQTCIVPTISVSLHERFTPEGELANASRLKLQEHLKRPPQVQIEVEEGRILSQLQPQRKSSKAAIYESGNRLGSLEFHTEGDVLQIGVLSVIPDYQRLGIASTLFESVVHLNPQIKRIRAVMADDNRDVLLEAIERLKSPEAAILETPAYKIREKLGFSRVVPGSVKDISSRGSGRYEFTVERP